MTPILGIMASQISGHLFTPTGSMYHIASTTLSTTAASITFSSIPADYTHLQLRSYFTPYSTAGDGFVQLTFNSDTAANYSWHYLSGNGSAAGAGALSGASQLPFSVATGTGNSSLYPGVSVCDILDYANTSKYKTLRAISGIEQNTNSGGTNQQYLFSGNWRNTAAITSISIPSPYGSFNSGTTIALYGVK